MKRIFFNVLVVICFIFSVQNIDAQSKLEVGAFAGTSYYYGDLNTFTPFYNPSPSIGGTLRYVLNDRQAFRTHVFFGQFKGSGNNYTNEFQPPNISFSATLLDLDAIYEFNFLTYHYNDRYHAWTPYLFVGLGYEIILQSKYNIPDHFAVPFGMGVKYMLTKRTTIGGEWGFRKTFRNQIDGVENAGGNTYKSLLNNNDWYSFAGIFISFRLFDNGNCAVYQ